MPDLLNKGFAPIDRQHLTARIPGCRPSTGAGAIRRGADVVVALLMLLLTLPLLLLVALAIRLDGSGPVLRRRPHIGRNGQRFDLLTFSSTQEDPFGRTLPTPLGHFIRPTRIDQLPILLNLLRGDLTLVGPAPIPLGEAQQAPIPHPGVTGWAGAD